jgi:hypothetical protein
MPFGQELQIVVRTTISNRTFPRRKVSWLAADRRAELMPETLNCGSA